MRSTEETITKPVVSIYTKIYLFFLFFVRAIQGLTAPRLYGRAYYSFRFMVIVL